MKPIGDIGEQFGKRVPGSFTDEPNIRPAGGLPWTDHLPAAFQKRWGYNLLDHLPSLSPAHGRLEASPARLLPGPQGAVHRALEQALLTITARSTESRWTGHYWDHEWPNCRACPTTWPCMPGTRSAGHRLPDEPVPRRYPRPVRQRADGQGACQRRQPARPRAHAVRGLRRGRLGPAFRGHEADRRLARGAGRQHLDQHLSYVTLRGARKADHPQSFSYHEPWWEAYHVLAEYFTRLRPPSATGEQINEILVIEPTTTAWMYQADARKPRSSTSSARAFSIS